MCHPRSATSIYSSRAAIERQLHDFGAGGRAGRLDLEARPRRRGISLDVAERNRRAQVRREYPAGDSPGLDSRAQDPRITPRRQLAFDAQAYQPLVDVATRRRALDDLLAEITAFAKVDAALEPGLEHEVRLVEVDVHPRHASLDAYDVRSGHANGPQSERRPRSEQRVPNRGCLRAWYDEVETGLAGPLRPDDRDRRAGERRLHVTELGFGQA